MKEELICDTEWIAMRLDELEALVEHLPSKQFTESMDNVFSYFTSKRLDKAFSDSF